MAVIGTVTKHASERRTVPIEYYGRMPFEGLTFQSTTLTAKDLSDQSDATNTVLNSASATVSGHRLLIPTKAGASGKTYRVTVQADMSDGYNRFIDEFDLKIE